MRRVLLLTLLVCLLAPAASVASGRDVVRDCLSDGQLNGHYSEGELRQGLAELPTDAREYTDCGDQIRQAQREAATRRHRPAAGGGSHGGGGPGKPQPPASKSPRPDNPTEATATDEARRRGGTPVPIGGKPIVPGTSGLSADDLRHTVPTPLILVLVLLGLTALGGAATLGARRGAPLRTFAIDLRDRVLSRRRS